MKIVLKTIYILILVFLQLTYVLLAAADDDPISRYEHILTNYNLSKDEYRQLNFELKFNSMMVKYAQEISENSEILESEELLENALKETSDKIMYFLESNAENSEVANELKIIRNDIKTKTHFNKFTRKIVNMWKGISNFFIKMPLQFTKKMMRMHGMGIAITYGSAYIVHAPIVASLAATSNPALALFAFEIPNLTLALYSSIYFPLKNYLVHKELKRLLGDDYEGYIQTKQMIKKEFSNKTMVDQIFNDEYLLTFKTQTTPINYTEAVIFKQYGGVDNLLDKLGFHKELNYENLKKFCLKANIEISYIELLEKSILNNKLKTIQLLSKIIDSEDELNIFKVKEKFSKNFKEIRDIPHWESAKLWTYKMFKSETFEELLFYSKSAPEEIPSELLFKSWENIIFPEISAKFPFKLNTLNIFRQLKKNLVTLKGTLLNPQIPNMEKTLFFKSYIEDAIPENYQCGSKILKDIPVPLPL